MLINLQKDLTELVKDLQDNKYIFVAYTGQSTQKNTSRWFKVLPSKNWSVLRHQIESYGTEILEDNALRPGTHRLMFDARPTQNTIVRGFVQMECQRLIRVLQDMPKQLRAFLEEPYMLNGTTELTGQDYIGPNTFIFLIRSAIPLGGKAYVPMEEKAKYALARHKIAANPEDVGLQDKLTGIQKENENKFHASERICKTVLVKNEATKLIWIKKQVGFFDEPCNAFVRAETSCKYLEPPLDYLCSECRQYGLHYKEACHLFPRETKADAFGSNKFKSFTEIQSKDVEFYSLLHKRHKTVV